MTKNTLTNEQFNALKRYKEIITTCKSIVSEKTAKEIWQIWKTISERHIRFSLCSVCITKKVKWLNKILEEYKDDSRWNPKPKKKKTETEDN